MHAKIHSVNDSINNALSDFELQIKVFKSQKSCLMKFLESRYL